MMTICDSASDVTVAPRGDELRGRGVFLEGVVRMMGEKNKTTLRLAALLMAMAAIVLCLCGSASGAELHEYTGVDIGPDGASGNESFERATGVTVDPGSEDIYVFDAGTGRIYKFDSTGAPSNFSTLGKNYISGVPGNPEAGYEQLAVSPPGAVGGTEGDIFLATPPENNVQVFASDGSKLGELAGGVAGSFLCGVAVGPTGHVLISRIGHIYELVPSSNSPLMATLTAETKVQTNGCNVAVDSTGAVYGAHQSGKIETETPGQGPVFIGGVEKLKSTEATETKIVDLEGVTLAVESGTDDLYSDRKNQIAQYTPKGKRIGSFGEGIIENSRALAVSPLGARVYVATPGKVKVFGPKIELPEVEIESATELTTTSGTLHGTIEPDGILPATCQFEYVLESSYLEHEAIGAFAGSITAPCDPAGPFTGAGQDAVSAHIDGLMTRRPYRFRLQGSNGNGGNFSETGSFNTRPIPLPAPHTFGSCPNESLRAGPGVGLPDCRAYELVSPSDKWGSVVEPFEGNLNATADGSAVTWYTGESASGIPAVGDAGHQDPALYLSTLGAGTWLSQRLLPPEADGERGHFSGMTADGRYALLEASARGGDEPGLYLLDTSNQEITPILPPQVGRQVSNRAFAFDGSSADDVLFYFETSMSLVTASPLNPAPTPGKDNLYVWNRETGQLSVAGLLPGAKGESPSGGSFGGAYDWWGVAGANSLEIGGALNGQYVGALHAVSESGDRVYFTAGKTGQLYLRGGLTGAHPITVRVSAAVPGVTDPHGEQPSAFQEATPNGELVYFISSAKLTANANTGSADEGSDLYRYDATTKGLVDVTPIAGGAGARVQGLLGISQDGKAGYLAARGVLATGGVNGENNLYHFEEAAAGTFVYRLVGSLPLGSSEEQNWSPESGAEKGARVSADGATLVFLSSAQLTEEPQGHCAYGRCRQVYRYSMSDDTLDCLSCSPYAEIGATAYGGELTPQTSPNLVPENYPIYGSIPRNLSAEGTRVFFQTSEVLSPGDVNGQDCTSPLKCADVYEWEAPGTPGGSCQAAEVNGGCLYLVSSGDTDDSSYFVDASADGGSVFLVSKSRFVPADEDQLEDIYDARIDGGIAVQQVTASPTCSSAEACKGASSVPPPSGTAGTASFQGQGDAKTVPPRQCKKGNVRKHGECVKKPKKKNKSTKKTKSKEGKGKEKRPADKKHPGGAK